MRRTRCAAIEAASARAPACNLVGELGQPRGAVLVGRLRARLGARPRPKANMCQLMKAMYSLSGYFPGAANQPGTWPPKGPAPGPARTDDEPTYEGVVTSRVFVSLGPPEL